MGAGCCLAQRRRAGFDKCSAKESWQNRVLRSNCDFSAHFPVVTSASPIDPRCTSHTAAKNSPQWILLLRMSAPNAASALGCSGCHIVGSVHHPIQHVLWRQTRSPASVQRPSSTCHKSPAAAVSCAPRTPCPRPSLRQSCGTNTLCLRPTSAFVCSLSLSISVLTSFQRFWSEPGQ